MNPYRAQLPTAGTGARVVRWVVDASTLAAGYSFDPVKGITFADASNHFSNPRRFSPGVFEFTAKNAVPDLSFEYTITLVKSGQPNMVIDPSLKNGPHN